MYVLLVPLCVIATVLVILNDIVEVISLKVFYLHGWCEDIRYSDPNSFKKDD